MRVKGITRVTPVHLAVFCGQDRRLALHLALLTRLPLAKSLCSLFRFCVWLAAATSPLCGLDGSSSSQKCLCQQALFTPRIAPLLNLKVGGISLRSPDCFVEEFSKHTNPHSPRNDDHPGTSCHSDRAVGLARKRRRALKSKMQPVDYCEGKPLKEARA